MIKSEDNGDQVKQPAIGTKDSNIQNQLGSNIILNSTSEFCRNLGEIPTYGLAGNREEEREEIMVSCLFSGLSQISVLYIK